MDNNLLEEEIPDIFSGKQIKTNHGYIGTTKTNHLSPRIFTYKPNFLIGDDVLLRYLPSSYDTEWYNSPIFVPYPTSIFEFVEILKPTVSAIKTPHEYTLIFGGGDYEKSVVYINVETRIITVNDPEEPLPFAKPQFRMNYKIWIKESDYLNGKDPDKYTGDSNAWSNFYPNRQDYSKEAKPYLRIYFYQNIVDGSENNYNFSYVGVKWEIIFRNTYDDLMCDGYTLALTGSRIENILEDVSAWNGDNSDDTYEGSTGTWNNSSDDVWFDSLPTIDLNNGNTRLYYLTIDGYKRFGEWLWDSDFITNVKKYFNSPAECIISASLVSYYFTPVNDRLINVGNIETDVRATEISNWILVDCGELSPREYYGSFADYNPFTQVKLYLPHVGFIDIDTDIVMNNTIAIQYRIELLSGDGVCQVGIINNRYNNRSIYMQLPCHCTMNIPLSMRDKSEMIGASINAVSNAVKGTVIGAVGGGATGALTGFGGAVVSGALDVATSKNHYPSVGGLSSASGILGKRKPYIIIQRTPLSHPTSYPNTMGYMNNTTQRLGDLKGFTVVEDCHIEFATQVNEEKDEILSLLKSGIIL